jgi:polyisoprenyl-teichoic acid--peptidoglycan teichoic acid transferase
VIKQVEWSENQVTSGQVVFEDEVRSPELEHPENQAALPLVADPQEGGCNSQSAL